MISDIVRAGDFDFWEVRSQIFRPSWYFQNILVIVATYLLFCHLRKQTKTDHAFCCRAGNMRSPWKYVIIHYWRHDEPIKS